MCYFLFTECEPEVHGQQFYIRMESFCNAKNESDLRDSISRDHFNHRVNVRRSISREVVLPNTFVYDMENVL